MFQGIKALRELNWNPLPVLPETIDYVLLTHGHLDHCGWLPRLVREGFRGKIYCTAPTKEIARLIIIDSAKIQEEEAEAANKGKFSRHLIAEPLYTTLEAERVLPFFRVAKAHERVSLDAEIEARFLPAGHILGACSIELTLENKTLLFSGDIGRDNDVLMYPPERPQQADFIFLESTYGNRHHPEIDALTELEAYITSAIDRGGTVIIPGFAVERAQTVMHLLYQLRQQDRLPDVPCILDSPMGVDVLQIFSDYPSWHKLNPHQCAEMARMFTLITDYQDTIATVYNDAPKIIIAASGMITGGRVLTYLERYIGRPETSVILVGYQAEGTRGRKLLEGAEEIKIHGKYYAVKATVLEVKGMSAHGDQQDLLNWLSSLKQPPRRVFLVHGDNIPADELRTRIADRFGYAVNIPMLGQKYIL